MISDKGRGMSQAEIDRAIGDGRAASARQPDGALENHGLGLRLAKHLVEAHGGSLKIKSEVGAGTIATIILPL